MGNSGYIAEKWHTFINNIRTREADPGDAELTGWGKTKKILRIAGRVIFHLRKIFMAIPVVYYALRIAAYSAANLPETVGLSIQSDGSFAYTISRATAVNMPLMVTGACLALMFLSRKTVYPWVISIFSLILPFVLLLTNVYPC